MLRSIEGIVAVGVFSDRLCAPVAGRHQRLLSA